MELRDYIRVLRRSWILVLTCVVLGGVLAATATWRAERIYAASVTMVVSSQDSADGAASAYQGTLLSQQRVKSYADLVASERVAAVVVERLGLGVTAATLRNQISAYAVPDTVLLRATVVDPNPARAQAVADAVGVAFSETVQAIETPGEGLQASVRVSVWERAKLPSSPVSPRPTRNLMLGLLLGLLASVAAALVRHRLDTSVSGSDDATAATGLPTLAAIAFDGEAARRPLITQAGPHAPRAEAFRQLRTNLQFVDVDTTPRTIVVTSSVPAEGKTSTSCNLAITLAQSGARVVLVEGDLRRPSFGEYLGVESAAGLTSVLIGAADIDDVLQPWGEGRVGDGRIEVLPSGPVPPNPSELLGSRGMTELLSALAARFDIVLVDAPPLLPVTDAAVLATQTDGVLLVARVGRTKRDQLARAAAALRAVDGRLLGMVLNMVPIKGPNAYYYGHYDSYAPRGRHARVGAAPGSAGRPEAAHAGLMPAGDEPDGAAGRSGGTASGGTASGGTASGGTASGAVTASNGATPVPDGAQHQDVTKSDSAAADAAVDVVPQRIPETDSTARLNQADNTKSTGARRRANRQ